MREDRKELIDELLKGFKNHRNFETDKFLYWIRDDYYYNGKKVTREEFEKIKDYAIKHGTLPFISIQEKINTAKENSKRVKEDKDFDIFSAPLQQSTSHNELVNTSTYSRQRIVRYSKTYENVEVYDYDIEVRSPSRAKVKRVIVFSRKNKLFSVNDKNYVLIKGNRWLSLKNWHGFKTNDFSGLITDKVASILMNMMLGGKEWISNFEETVPYYITNKNSRKANSLDEAIGLECGLAPAKTIKRALKNDINDVINLYNIIDSNKVPYLTNFIKRNHENLSLLLEKTYYQKSEMLLFYFFLSKDNRCEQHTFHDYIRMLKQEGGKINLNINSYTTIKRNHDNISRVILEKNKDKSRIRVSKKYPKIKSIPGLEVEMIRKSERLDEESKMLHHCVHGYKSTINKGDCAIYSLVHEDERYTLQINSEQVYDETETIGVSIPRTNIKGEDVYELKIAQLKGKYNCSPPESLKVELEKICEQHEVKLPSSIRFVDKVKKTEEKKAPVVAEKPVKQIGEEILGTLVKNIVSEGPTANTELLPF